VPSLQATRPHTIGYALSDSPVGLAAWIYEKFQAWTDNTGDVESALTRDEMLDDITLYWLANTASLVGADLSRERRQVRDEPGQRRFSRGAQHLPEGNF
jgi:hypothetical protein